jgi:putative transposase
LKSHDYRSNCFYMVTLNTLHRKKYFGTIVTTGHGPSLQSTPMTNITLDCWNQIPLHYPYVKLDAFVIMPNHIHGILKIEPNNPSPQASLFGGQKSSLGSVINGYKSSVKRIANEKGVDFQWQPRYHDIIIHTEQSLNNCCNYIQNNLSNYK